MAFTITTSASGSFATVVGTNSSDSISSSSLVNISFLSLIAFDADDVVVTGTTQLSGASPSNLSLGSGNDLVTLSAAINAAGSLIDLGDGSDSLGIGSNDLTGVSVRGMGGVDQITLGASTLTSTFINGNEGGDRITIGSNSATVLATSTIVGGSESDRFYFNTTGSITGGRINGQDGNDWMLITRIGAGTTTTMYGGQGNDNLSASSWSNPDGFVILSGDLGDDRLNGAAQRIEVIATTSGDRLFGGDGEDFIQGRGGADTMTGGIGVDTFAFSSPSTTFALTPVRLNDTDSNGAISAGDTVNLNTTQGIGSFNNWVTNITDFSGEDFIGYDLGVNPVSAIGQSFGGVASMTVFGSASLSYKLAGVYNAANSTFTVTNDNLGSDTLLLLEGQAANGYLLLKGTSASTLTEANFFVS